ncbi:MAG: flagellar M-ring protein FliF [Alphaproteobacteria bacterium]|nr:flagellar M-ring protein FliF [Alphaproteobacteria bacterium]
MDEAGSFFRNMSRIKVGGIAGIAVLMIAVFVMLTLRVSSGSMVPLYTGLSLEDSSKIVEELEKSGTPYELIAGGSVINVPSERVLRLRMGMAGQGIPSGGSVVGYEIFDRSETMGTSNFVMNINMVRALEGELSRTIGSLSGVETARVHLVMPKQEVFSREKQKPSASVTIRMRGGKNLESSEVTAITHLIASASPGLEASRVTVIDGHGRLLARGDGDASGVAATNAQEQRAVFETRTQQSLEDLLEKVVGPGKVRVQVAADMNFERVITDSEKYDPEGQVARSIQSTTEKENASEKSGKGDVSVAGNLPGGAAAGGDSANNNRSVDHAGETTNFEISKTVSKLIKEGGALNKLSVAVLVDGTYTKDADGNPVYAARTEDELKQIRTLINSSVGYDEKRGDKIEVVNMRFTQEGIDFGQESFFERFKLEMQSIIQTIIIAIVAILAIVLVLRPAVSQLIAQTQSPSTRVSAEMAALEGPYGNSGGQMRLPSMPAGAEINMGGGGDSGGTGEPELMVDVANIKGGMKSSSIKKINEIVDKYPEETMGVLRQWILKQS